MVPSLKLSGKGQHMPRNEYHTTIIERLRFQRLCLLLLVIYLTIRVIF